jgi:hypothetical protein
MFITSPAYPNQFYACKSHRIKPVAKNIGNEECGSILLPQELFLGNQESDVPTERVGLSLIPT